jgi:GDPmannose 4,6-dehydratase
VPTTAPIVGITGPDGAYLARFLLDKGYDVYGTSRNIGLARTDGLRALGIRDKVSLLSVSPVDFRSVSDAIERVAPQEIYNLSGQSSVALSFSQPAETLSSVTQATINFLEALRLKRSDIRFYNAGSSEIFGDTEGQAANEGSAYHPKSPYGVAKAAAVSLVANYRDAYGLFACSGLLFNHESPLRPDHFVTRKITTAAARIASGSGERLKLGDISIHRDWGWAPDYVEAMWMMLQHDRPEDFVIASGVAHRLDEFVSAAMPCVCVADARQQMRTFLAETLEDLGCVTCECVDVTELNAELGTRPPDLVVIGSSAGGIEACEMVEVLAAKEFGGKVLVLGPRASPMVAAIQELGAKLGLAMLPLLPTPFSQADLRSSNSTWSCQASPTSANATTQVSRPVANAPVSMLIRFGSTSGRSLGVCP